MHTSRAVARTTHTLGHLAISFPRRSRTTSSRCPSSSTTPSAWEDTPAARSSGAQVTNPNPNPNLTLTLTLTLTLALTLTLTLTPTRHHRRVCDQVDRRPRHQHRRRHHRWLELRLAVRLRHSTATLPSCCHHRPDSCRPHTILTSSRPLFLVAPHSTPPATATPPASQGQEGRWLDQVPPHRRQAALLP